MRNSNPLLPHTGEGIVIDIGTGDGRFVSALAKAQPNKYFIGVDANVKPLERPSMKATRKPAKGGLPNAMFVQAAVEDLPDELNGVADEIHIHFPWGSLLKAVVLGESAIIAELRRISAVDCVLEIVIGIDPVRDRSEVQRLEIPDLTDRYILEALVPRYEAVGFRSLRHGTLNTAEWAALETSWAKKLSGSRGRKVLFMVFMAV